MPKTQDHGDREHAPYAPSSIARLIHCRGSHEASKGLPNKSSIYAEEGTECHEAAGSVLEGMAWDKAVAGLSEDQEWIVGEYTNYVFDLIDRLIERHGKDGVKIWVETRVRSHLNELKDNHGTADFSILADRTLAVVDLKAGFHPVEIGTPDNPLEQLANYGLLAMDHHDLWGKVDKIRLTIFQPRVYDKPQTIILTPAQLKKFAVVLETTIAAVEAGDTTRNAGAWCKFCPAKGRCSTLRENAVERAKMIFDDAKLQHARNYEPEELAAILDEAEMMEAHINGVRAHVLHELLKGRLKGIGWKAVPKRPHSKWIDEQGLLDYLGKELRIDTTKIAYKPKLLTPLQLEKAIVGKYKGAEFDLKPFYEKKSSGPTLAPIDDPRPEWENDIFDEEK